MATVRDRGGKRARGVGVSLYITEKAVDLLERVAIATRRSRSELVTLLVETYGPQLLADSGKGPRQ